MNRERTARLVAGAALVWLVVLPCLFILAAAAGLIDDRMGRAVEKLLDDPAFPRILRNTLELAAWVAVLSGVLGSLLALAVERTRLRGPWLIDKLILVPILVSPLVGTVAWISLGRPNTGFLNAFWRLVTGGTAPLFSIFSFLGVVLVMTLHFAPYVYVSVRNALANTDGSMEEAALVLGAGPARIWSRITLPLVLPAILSGVLLAFVLAIETFSIAGLLGAPVRFINLPFNIYQTVHLPPGDFNYAALQGVVLLAMTGVLMAGYWLTIGHERNYSTVGGKGVRAAIRVPGAATVLLGIVAWTYIAIAVVLPIAALALQSVLAFATNTWADMVFTTGNWSRLLTSTAFLNALQNTLIIGTSAATAASLLAVFIAQLAVRERARALDWLATLPLAFPGIVLGLALVFLYAGTPLYGGWLIMIIGFTTQFLPFAVRAISGPMMQLDASLDEAGKVLGAPMSRRVLKLTAPMLRGPLLGAWILTFTRGFRELNVPIFLATPATTVVAVLLWSYMEFGQSGLAAALSLFQIGVLIALISLSEYLSRRLSAA